MGQSSLSTASQISSISRSVVVSIIPSTIWRNSSSEGMRPAPKTGS
jgi:hypothetical protein